MNLRPWITGIVLCLCGVLLVRLRVGGEYSWVFTAIGYALSGVGLFWIALGVRRRIDACDKDT